MGKVLELLRATQSGRRPLTLIASLPHNDPELARAALAGGADVVKVHVNVHHHASGTHFGSLDEERPALEEILKICQDRPVGIVPGGSAHLEAGELARLPGLGFDFLSLYSQHAPVGLLPPRQTLGRMIAWSCEDEPATAQALARLAVDVAELSIMRPESYGEPFTYNDLAHLAAAVDWTQPLPAVLPTQHRVIPEAVGEIRQIGVCGLMIGVIVAGETPRSWEAACRTFRAAIDAAFIPA